MKEKITFIIFLFFISWTTSTQTKVNPYNKKEKIIELNSVVIHAKKLKHKYIGSPKNKREINIYTANESFFQLGLKVDNKSYSLYKNANLISFAIKIVSPFILGVKVGIKPNGTNQLRLRIYKKNTKGKVW